MGRPTPQRELFRDVLVQPQLVWSSLPSKEDR